VIRVWTARRTRPRRSLALRVRLALRARAHARRVEGGGYWLVLDDEARPSWVPAAVEIHDG